jgi:N6-L-threonylcarbamoyladenine synthase
VGALLVGVAFARAFAAARGIPVAGVHHVEAHALAAQLMDPAPAMPFLSLVVSGGHTALYRVEGTDRIEPIAETVDDAAGEAFDKVARLMGLPWPGGPAIDRLAASGDADAVVLPRPSAADGHWSFAGLKTAARRAVERGSRPEDLAASFQRAVVDVLLARVQRAVVESRVPRVALGGGVAANSALRQRAVAELAADVFVPPRSLCTDNAAMVAHAGRMALLRGRTGRPIQARPALAIGAP